MLVQEAASRGCSPGRTSKRSRDENGFEPQQYLVEADSDASSTEPEDGDIEDDPGDDSDDLEPDSDGDVDDDDDDCEDMDEDGCSLSDDDEDDTDDGYADNLVGDFDFSDHARLGLKVVYTDILIVG